MERESNRSEKPRRDAGLRAEPLASRQCWLGRLIAGAIITDKMFDGVFSDLRLREADVQRDLRYGCE